MVGNLPLQGIKLLVRMAISRSRGESIIRQPVTPAALQPKPMHMAQPLFAAGTGTLKWFIQMKRHTGQIAKILQQGEQGKENRHRRQHDCNDTGQYVVDAVDQQTVQPVGRMYGFQQQRKPAL